MKGGQAHIITLHVGFGAAYGFSFFCSLYLVFQSGLYLHSLPQLQVDNLPDPVEVNELGVTVETVNLDQKAWDIIIPIQMLFKSFASSNQAVCLQRSL